MIPKICIAGPTAVGKTTLAQALVKELGAQFISTSELLIQRGCDYGYVRRESLNDRHFWLSPAAADFNDCRLEDIHVDRGVDLDIQRVVESSYSPIVVDSRVYPFLRRRPYVFCIYLTATLEVRVMRSLLDGGDKEDTRREIRRKDITDARIFKTAWGLDTYSPNYPNLFDLVIDDSKFEYPGVSRAEVKAKTFEAAIEPFRKFCANPPTSLVR